MLRQRCPSPQLVLTVDYTRAALTAILYVEEICVFDMLRMQHHVNLEAAALDACHTSTKNDNCYESLREVLTEIVKMPVDKPASVDVPSHISKLVLLGENATDPRLREILRLVLAGHPVANPWGDDHEQADIMVNPTYAGARGIAMESWGIQNGL